MKMARFMLNYKFIVYYYYYDYNYKYKYKSSISMIMQMKTKHSMIQWPYIPDHPYRILIGGSGSGKTNALLNLITTGQTSIKYICMLKIHMKLNTNFSLIKEKAQD